MDNSDLNRELYTAPPMVASLNAEFSEERKDSPWADESYSSRSNLALLEPRTTEPGTAFPKYQGWSTQAHVIRRESIPPPPPLQPQWDTSRDGLSSQTLFPSFQTAPAQVHVIIRDAMPLPPSLSPIPNTNRDTFRPTQPNYLLPSLISGPSAHASNLPTIEAGLSNEEAPSTHATAIDRLYIDIPYEVPPPLPPPLPPPRWNSSNSFLAPDPSPGHLQPPASES
ncbi:uncharacterized protein FOBCDRAFT_209162 [Fusarium oxysporum Fo47]|uniref:Uncharacterized protein n=1 Tax=Fusarium oxysporum Fo47 TaxID=660027 RepID=W9JV93_FUSOX|nr:uncharacterized protein FOBCDRAFT_209162 [Fusarium oxysporum Fo47]EWZ33163.1 hypothetical protein FOZG_12925 [Fusarium oxysporum Fo47]QKD62483.1 hypothetical protein FOBCDRAFT_209162 [Fusarium oxysporum Fo47]